MHRSSHVAVRINLARVAENTRRVRELVGVPVLAVIKADAYGLGAAEVARTIASLVDEFCIFRLGEAAEIELFKMTGKRALAIGPPMSSNADEYLAQGVRPAVSTLEQATALGAAGPVLCVDTGMQRFACAPDRIKTVLKAGDCREAYTHATRMEHVDRLVSLVGGRGLRLHAAGSSLLHEPAARLDAVRAGIALYRGAVRVTARLVEARDSHGPIGYTGFTATRHGVILAGYSHGLRPGPCLVDGEMQCIAEVGMQSAYVTLGPRGRTGDEVVLLGDSLTEKMLADEQRTSEQEVLVRMTGMGSKSYL